jgi:FkbM family methyltransferase
MNRTTELRPLGIQLRLKLAFANLLTADILGKLVGVFFSDGIPHEGSRIAVGHGRHRTAAMIFWNLYESAELRFIKKYWRTDLSTIELGSSVGVISSYLGRRLNPEKKLFCVEGNPQLIPVLKANVERNIRGAAFKLIDRVVYYDAPTVTFEIGDTNLTSRVLANVNERSANSVDAQATRLESIVEGIGDPWYQLVCDIEGAEVGMIINDAAALRKCAILVMETHETKYGEAEYSTDHIIELVQARSSLRLIDRYGPVCVFVNSNYLV